MISGLQTRAAGAFLTWDRRDLARKSVVSLSTIERLEGIEFAEDDGVFGDRLHPKGRNAKRK
jgi:hypothetical protein